MIEGACNLAIFSNTFKHNFYQSICRKREEKRHSVLGVVHML